MYVLVGEQDLVLERIAREHPIPAAPNTAVPSLLLPSLIAFIESKLVIVHRRNVQQYFVPYYIEALASSTSPRQCALQVSDETSKTSIQVEFDFARSNTSPTHSLI